MSHHVSLRRILFAAIVVVGILVALTASAVTVASNRVANSALAQFTSQGHALGFRAGEVLVANATYALRVQFVGANAVMPQSETPTAGVALSKFSPRNTKGKGNVAAELSRVTYANLWDGITLTYDAGGEFCAAHIGSKRRRTPGQSGCDTTRL